MYLYMYSYHIPPKMGDSQRQDCSEEVAAGGKPAEWGNIMERNGFFLFVFV